MPKFSIVIPTHNRADGRLQRALDSVVTQAYTDWECIVVDDGSTDRTSNCGMTFPSDQFRQFNFIRIKHQGRVAARNAGMEAAEGDFICWLDSDDAYDPMYLATFAHHIEQEPEAALWVCGVVVHGMIKDEQGKHLCPKYTELRRAWTPPADDEGQHTFFDSGRVGTGSFVFRRECFEEIGPLPPWGHPDDVADGIDEWLGLPFGTLGYGSGKRERETDAEPLLRKRGKGHVGNPWGDDHAYFQKLCLRYRARRVRACLYVQYKR